MCKHEQIVVDSRLETLFKVQSWFNQLYSSLESDLNWVKNSGDRLNIAVAEGFTNAVRHAHARLPSETPIAINVSLKDDRIDIHIWDYGDPFDPNQIPEPEPGSLLSEGGYGWFLLRRVVDQVTYRRQGCRNCLTISHHKPTP